MRETLDVISARSFARAGFLGNPSDGYFGKTIAFSFMQFCVDLRLVESSVLRFVPGIVDDAVFSSPAQLVRDLRLYGYYGGVRMLKAVAKLFFEYCTEHGLAIPERNFTAEYKINIPRLVGLSGSSAICSAMLKALMEFYGVEIPLEEQPTLVMNAEKFELGISCGLQDRVAQIYNGLTYMDFDRALVEQTGHGRYEALNFARMDPFVSRLFIAYDPRRAEESGKAHRSVNRRFHENDRDVTAAMHEFADIARQGREALVTGSYAKLPALINANFDLRDRIFSVSEENRRMVMKAREVGAAAKFAGSGGAIVGLVEDDAQFKRLSAALETIGCRTFHPTIATKADESKVIEASSPWRNS